MSQRKPRWVWFAAIGLLALALLSLFVAPRTASSGSTYGRAPDGYGAWYAYMQQQGAPIQRWRKPLQQLEPEKTHEGTSIRFPAAPVTSQPTPVTLLQISPGHGLRVETPTKDWFKQGNVLVRLGVQPPLTQAPFRSLLDSPVGKVKIETSRRASPEQALLKDQYGAVVWQEPIREERIISAATPYLAANAYQDEPGNFKFLEKLVTAPGYPIYVDEYLHGYKDSDTIAHEASGGVLGYLVRTPLFLVAVQAAVILLVLLFGKNQRLGAPLKLIEPQPDNSQAYIQALATVLRKAGSSDFVKDTIGKAEQLNVQRSLGLGTTELLDPQAVIAAWQQQGRSAEELAAVLRQDEGRLSEGELLSWVRAIEEVRRQV
jgi:Domain of unknown function (DUF4350)